MQNVLSHFHTLSHAYWKRQEIQFLRWETTLCCRVSVNYTRLRLCLCCSWVSCEYRRLEQYFFHFDWLTEAAWPLYQKRRNAAFARIALRILHCAQKSRNQANLHECSPKYFQSVDEVNSYNVSFLRNHGSTRVLCHVLWHRKCYQKKSHTNVHWIRLFIFSVP